MPSFLVVMRVTHIQEYFVDAKDEDEAKHKAEKFDGEEGYIISTPDWEVVRVEPNE